MMTASFKRWWGGVFLLALVGLSVGMVVGGLHTGAAETTQTLMTTYTTAGINQQFTDLDKAMFTWVNNLVLAVVLLVLAIVASRYLAACLLFIQMLSIGIVFGGHMVDYGIFPVVMYILPHGLMEIGIYSYLVAFGAQIDKNAATFIETMSSIYIVKKLHATFKLVRTHLVTLDHVILALLLLAFAAYIEVFVSPWVLLTCLG